MERLNVSTGTVWESSVGYSRAVRRGKHVFVAGTTAADSQGNVVGIGDPYAQTKYIIQKIEDTLIRAGATLNDVTRTRIFVTDISNWELIGKAHGDFFRDIRPATTMVEVRSLLKKEMLVEIEVDALITS